MFSPIRQIYTYRNPRDILTKIINCSTYYQRKTLFYNFSVTIKDNLTLGNQSWYKGNKLVEKGEILSFRNIKRDRAGNYTCKVQSGTLTDKTELKIIVQCKYLCTDLYIKLLFSTPRSLRRVPFGGKCGQRARNVI